MLRSPYVLLILATLFWGGNFTLGRAITGSIPPITLSFIRWAEAFIIFLPFVWQEFIKHRAIILKNWYIFSVLGITGVAGFNMCVYLSVQYTTAINASLINSFTPVVVTIFSITFLQEKLSIQQWLGIIVSFFGVMWIVVKGSWYDLIALNFNKGDVIMLVAVILWGIYTIVLKKKSSIASQKTIFAASIISGLMWILPLVIYENYYTGLSWIKNLNYVHYLSLVYFGIFPTILSFMFFNKALIKIGPSRSAIFSNLVVVFASFFSIVFLNDKLILPHIVGGMLIITGVYLTSNKN